jgi:hypothetical protein
MICDVETQELFPLAEQDQKQDNGQQERKPKNLAEFMEMFYPDQKKEMKPKVIPKQTRIDPEDILDEEDDDDE